MRRSQPFLQRTLLSSVIARHGDRAPSINLTFNKDDHHRWNERLPSLNELEEIGKRFPVCFESPSESPKDQEVHPFGALTVKGGQQMESFGKILKQRVEQESPIKPKEIRAFASNYNRTQQSCQYFLKGLLTSKEEEEEENHRGGQLEITVPETHYLNPFDTPSHLINENENIWELCAALSQNETMMKAEDEMTDIKRLLCEKLPGFGVRLDEHSHHDINARFKWIKAADYFYCADSHMDDHAHETLAHPDLPLRVQQHSAWRFHHWYSDDDILRLTSRPFLSTLAQSIVNKLQGSNDDKGVSCQIYLSHDIILLAIHKSLEYAMEKYSGIPVSDECSHWWPAYGSGLLFELVTRDDGKVDVIVSATPRHEAPPFPSSDDKFQEFASFPVEFFLSEFK